MIASGRIVFPRCRSIWLGCFLLIVCRDSVGFGQEAGEQLVRVEVEAINLFKLLAQGSYLMIPIVAMSLIVVTFIIERLLGLRRGRVLPRRLVKGLGKSADGDGAFDPREAYRLCQRYPSAAANVVRAMLLKVGRPQRELEEAAAEASQREATRLYANVRWLNLAAAVTPLMGLLGTVWGMIRAFHDTTLLAPGLNKADHLAEGIYVALVTTLGGLVVAIPAAICAHYFEGRIHSWFLQIDELLFELMLQMERFEGRVRFGQPGPGDFVEDHVPASSRSVPAPPPPVVRDASPLPR